jgi:hypothetical protein
MLKCPQHRRRLDKIWPGANHVENVLHATILSGR